MKIIWFFAGIFIFLMIGVCVTLPPEGPSTTSVSTTTTSKLPPDCVEIATSEVYPGSEMVGFVLRNNCGIDILITELGWFIKGANINTGEKLLEYDNLGAYTVPKENLIIKINASQILKFKTGRDNIYDVYTTVEIDTINYEPSSP